MQRPPFDLLVESASSAKSVVRIFLLVWCQSRSLVLVFGACGRVVEDLMTARRSGRMIAEALRVEATTRPMSCEGPVCPLITKGEGGILSAEIDADGRW